MRCRVDDLAARAGVSVDTIRFYQGKGLLPPPEREGRVAWYSGDHLATLERIRALKSQGFTLASIRRILTGELDAPDRALAEALAGAGEDDGGELLTLEELARSTGVSAALLEALAREGLLVPGDHEGEARYTSADVKVVAAGLELLETGLPLSELLSLAREHDRVMRAIADRAVEMFVRFVRDPVRAQAESDEDAAERLVAAFRKMLPAVSNLVAHHFRRILLERGRRRIEADGEQSEIEAVRAESTRGMDVT